MRKHVDFEPAAFTELAQGPVTRPGYAARISALGPVAYWRSRDGAALLPDTSGHGHDGAILSGTVTATEGTLFRDADPGVSLSQARIEVPTHPTLSGFDDFTLAFWARLPSLAGVQAIVGVLNVVNSQASWQAILWEAMGGVALRLSTDGATLTNNVVVIPSTSITLNQWHHYIFRRQGNTVDAILDGDLIDTATYAGTLYAAPEPLEIGVRQASLNHLTGDLDEITLFDTALADATIAELDALGRGRFINPG
ncbi:MAG: LamG domain-containing protein [Phycisphaeraceae bacterium]